MRSWQSRKKRHYLQIDRPICHIRNGVLTKLTRKKERVNCKNCLNIINGWSEMNGWRYRKDLKKDIGGLIKFMGWKDKR